MKIKTKFVLTFFVVAVLFLLIGFVSVRQSQKILESTIGEHNVSLAHEALNKIDRALFDRIEELQLYAKDHLLYDSLVQSNKEFEQLDDLQDLINKRDKEWTSLPVEVLSLFMQRIINNSLSLKLREIVEFYDEKYGYKVLAEIFVTNKYGANIAQTGKTSDYRQDDEDWWRLARQDGFYISDSGFDKSAGVNSIDICLRIEDDGGNFFGVMKTVLNIEELLNIVREMVPGRNKEQAGHGFYGHEEHRTIKITLLTSSGKIIVSTDKAESLTDVPEELLSYLNQATSPGYAIVEAAKPGEGEKLLAYAHSEGYRDYKGVGWILVLEHKTAELFRPVATLWKFQMIILSGVTIAAIVLGGLIAHSVAAPILKLEKKMVEVGDGRLDATIDIKSNDEIGSLAESFNSMLERLKKSTTSIKDLNKEIVERVQIETELQQSKTKLEIANREIDENRQKLQIALNEISGLIKNVVGKGDIDVRFENPGLSRCHEIMNCKREDCPGHGRETSMRCWQIAGTFCRGEVQGAYAQKIGSCVECLVFKEATADPIYRIGEHFNNMMEVIKEKTHEVGQRVKELNCLYAISHLAEQEELSLDELLQEIVEVIPPSWQYPEITCARIMLEEREMRTENFQETAWRQASDIIINGRPAGSLEVCYLEERVASDEGPFSLEERNLINAIAERLGQIVVRIQATQEKQHLQAFVYQQEKLASVGQLAAGVAHEINNPIGFISSNLGTLKKYTAKFMEYIDASANGLKAEELQQMRKKLKIDFISEDIKDLVKESIEGTERVKEIVQNLKSFSRVDDIEVKEADINECLESTIKVIWNELKYKAKLIKEYGELPLVKCYPQQLNQVFMNFLINAVHAIEKEGEIKIKTWQDGKDVFVSISDTGHGIPAENINKLFEPFFTTKEVGKGTGLGLSIAHEIIQKHNGMIDVESEVGTGTTFTVNIPVAGIS